MTTRKTPHANAVPKHAPRGHGLQVIGNSGKPVDWWFIYKISRDSTTSAKAKATGKEYLYYDSDMAGRSAKPVLSPGPINKKGALCDTFSQLFTPAARANKRLGWFCYNDEDRKDAKGGGTGPSNLGHCKGALAFDLGTDTAFWLIHSVPLLPMNARFVYPPTGVEMAQTMLCIQLANADTARHIAQLIHDAHGPNVNVASDLLTGKHKHSFRKGKPVSDVVQQLGESDPRVMLMRGSSRPKPTPYANRVPFHSRGKQKFIAIAKNRAWGKDFYNDLVSTVLAEGLEVETWERAKGKIPPPTEKGEKHPVHNTSNVDLGGLGFPYKWSELNDHAKLAISDRHNRRDRHHYVCVGDINFTDSMEKRGGGTVAFVCEPLWQALILVLVEGTPATKAASSKPAKRRPTDK